MKLSDQIQYFGSRIIEKIQLSLSTARGEIDLVLIYSVTSGILFVELRLQMLERIVIAQGWEGNHHLRALFVLLREDMLYLAALTILCLLICTRPASSSRIRAGVIIAYCSIVFISLLFLSVNVEMAPMYSTQLDYSLLKFSGLMAGPTRTVIAVVPSTFLLNFVVVFVSLLAALFLTLWTFYQKHRRVIRRTYCIIVACGLIAVMTVSSRGTDLERREMKNSLAYFLTSVATSPRLPHLDNSGVEPTSAPASSNTIVLQNVNRSPLPNAPENVLVIVLESVGAEYFELLIDNGMLPTLSKMMSSGVYFKRAYASAPISNVSLVAMLTSTGPLASYKLVTADYPHAKLTTSYEKLKSRGVNTGFFWSNDSQFLGIDKFLQNRGIDLNQDYRQRKCAESHTLDNGGRSLPYMYSADICTASSLLKWIDDNGDKSFFATVWTEQTHYPYAASESCVNSIAAKDEVLHPKDMGLYGYWPRYASALCDTDRMMEKILSGLRERNLLEKTLIIVVGDHGEGFGQHDSFVHGSEIFEDEIRVPLLISAGHSLSGRVDDRLASHLDIAPTIASAFGIASAEQWEGNDLLDNRAPRRVYFYTGWGNYKIGYREENTKYVYDVMQQKLSSYDLANDPHENESITGRDHAADAEAISLIKEWYVLRTRFANTLY